MNKLNENNHTIPVTKKAEKPAELSGGMENGKESLQQYGEYFFPQ